MRVLTCIGDATSIDAHGGLPFHLLEAGRHAGFIDAGWKLAPEKLRARRLIWNLKRLAMRGETGGYQYSMDFLRALTKQTAGPVPDADEIISIFPLFPMEHSKYTSVSLYLDATLKNNFEDYKLGEKLGRSLVSETLERERSLYRSAARIMCRSRMAAKSVVEDYGIQPSKVHFVPAGANISRHAAALQQPNQLRALNPVRLGFLGKDWRRKNLPFILEVADVLQARGIDVEVVAAGFDPAKGPTHPLLRPMGFIAKRNDLKKFVEFIGSCHFMCLFSFAEAFGISNREALQLGVPVLAGDVGGIRDTLPDDCGHLFASDAAAVDVADVIESYVHDADRYAALRTHVAARNHEFTWDSAVQKMIAIWNGSDAHSYARYASKIS